MFKSIKGVLPYDGPLAEFGVKWLGDHTAAEAALKDCLQTATTERAVQSVIEEHPVLLTRALGGGHGRWVIPQAWPRAPDRFHYWREEFSRIRVDAGRA
jgi:hypothetical protein